MHGPLNVKLINKLCVLKSLLLKRYSYVTSSAKRAKKKDIRFRKIFVQADKQTTV